MLASVASAAVRGVESYLVRVEVNLAPGLPSFAVVGLPEGAVREGRERVTAALHNTGRPLPLRRITVNLAPAGSTCLKRAPPGARGLKGRAPARPCRRWRRRATARRGPEGLLHPLCGPRRPGSLGRAGGAALARPRRPWRAHGRS